MYNTTFIHSFAFGTIELAQLRTLERHTLIFYNPETPQQRCLTKTVFLMVHTCCGHCQRLTQSLFMWIADFLQPLEDFFFAQGFALACQVFKLNKQYQVSHFLKKCRIPSPFGKPFKHRSMFYTFSQKRL